MVSYRPQIYNEDIPNERERLLQSHNVNGFIGVSDKGSDHVKRFVAMCTAIMLIAVLATACGGKNETNSSPSASQPNASETAASSGAAKKDITLTYIASQDWIKDAEMELAKKFEEKTGIHIDYQIIPADQYFNVLKTKLNSGEGPDLFGGQSGKSEISLNYNAEKNAVDLSDQEWVKREDPLSIDQLSLNGKVYAQTIWDTSNSYVLVYNKKIFADQGLSVPTTYAGLKEAALKIQKAGITPIYEPVADGWHHVLWFAEPGPQYDKLQPNLYNDLNANKANFETSAPMITSLTQLKEMYDLGFFGDNALSDTFADTANQMATGKFAMALMTQDLPQQIEKINPELKATDFGFFVIPLADNQFYYVNPGGPSKFVYSGGKHIEEAKQYLSFLAEPDNLQYLLDNTPTFSNLNFAGLKDKYTDEQKKLHETYPVKGTDIQDYVNYVNPQWMDMGKDIVGMFGGAMQPVDVLKSIDKRRSDMAKIAKDEGWNK
ncbi:carbohydrate ABC transporter substrate-binding protein [Cohnella cholangitidis]|uniref:Carbohydrate ABC transporter substrate-binding protein n=1 Tax=Cohnella cholangitidis TaxID=2598458 RepID=A0A7G5C297_9BACL|nr:carbohydrate ABC transporter substrate-binding protein [Cohnella cholangitidis]